MTALSDRSQKGTTSVPLLDLLPHEPDDPLLALIHEFRDDPRPDKVDLGVGVYRNEAGQTPVLEAVKLAERGLCDAQSTKSYLGLAGDLEFVRLLWEVVGGGAVDPGRLAGLQTVGASGALRVGAELLRLAGSPLILVGLPTWPNHAGILAAAGFPVRSYPSFDVRSQTALMSPVMDALSVAQPGSAVLLHGCCHNPTGVDLTSSEWGEIASIVAARGLIPLIDLAYQGFGRGLDQDVSGLRTLLTQVPTALVAVSASKSFGLYRERTGALFAVTSSPKSRAAVQSQMQSLARTSYSMPPDHGAAIVRAILTDATLRKLWTAELGTMRSRIADLRRALADAFSPVVPALEAIATQRGMFSLMPLQADDVQELKQRYGIYMPMSGRINIAGLQLHQVDEVADALTGPLRRKRSSV